jgi:hypothetical protein
LEADDEESELETTDDEDLDLDDLSERKQRCSSDEDGNISLEEEDQNGNQS